MPVIVTKPVASSVATSPPLDEPPLELPPLLLLGSPLEAPEDEAPELPPLLDVFVSPLVPSSPGVVLDSALPQAAAANERPAARIPPTYSSKRMMPPRKTREVYSSVRDRARRTRCSRSDPSIRAAARAVRIRSARRERALGPSSSASRG